MFFILSKCLTSVVERRTSFRVCGCFVVKSTRKYEEIKNPSRYHYNPVIHLWFSESKVQVVSFFKNKDPIR